jgi:hypothetical protein
VGISRERLAVYCKSGRVKLVDTAFSNPRLDMLSVSLKDAGRLAIGVDYDRGDVPKVSGQITIVIGTANAAAIVEELRARLPAGD